MYGRRHLCLLDTGSELSVVPARCVPPNCLKATTQTLNAANGSDIPVAGEAAVSISLNGEEFSVPCLVSDHVDEIMLGLSFLETNGCVWDFQHQTIEINGTRHRLTSHKPSWNSRRLVLREGVEIPARCRRVVSARTVYSYLSDEQSEWASRPIELQPGVRLARTLVADRPDHVNVQIVNTNFHVALLPSGLSLGPLDQVTKLCKDDDSDNYDELTHLDCLRNGVDASVPDETKAAFGELLAKYASVFSRGDHDLGCATAVKHRIVTGERADPFVKRYGANRLTTKRKSTAS